MFGHLPGPSVCCQLAATVYRAHFCGLGTSLHRHYGAWARLLVNRDSAFVALLGSAVAKSPPRLGQATCCNRFAMPRDLVTDGHVLQYTAAVTVCGLSAKLDDDAQDERGWRRWAANLGLRTLDAPIGDALGFLHAMNFPVAEVRGWMDGQRHIENGVAGIHECAGATRAAYGEIIGHLADLADAPAARPALGQLGEELGFLIYAHDAWEDWAEDRRRGQFNPLHGFPQAAARRDFLLPLLAESLTRLREAFDNLPLHRYRDLLGAVLIDGAGHRVAQVREGGGKKDSSRKKTDHTSRNERRWCEKWDCCDCPADCCDCTRCCRGSKSGGSICDCNPCDGDGIGCCGCDCSP
jgi:hypothetical protein